MNLIYVAFDEDSNSMYPKSCALKTLGLEMPIYLS